MRSRARNLSELEDSRPSAADEQSSDALPKAPLTTRILLRESLSARSAAGIIAGATVVITVAGGILARVFDHQDFQTIGKGLWFALQTVTTVGYGDATPRHTIGRLIAAIVMLSGIGFLAVITASVTASLVDTSRRRVASDVDVAQRLEDISERLARLEAALDRLGTPPSRDDA